MTTPDNPPAVSEAAADNSAKWDVDWDRLINEAVARMPPPCEHEFGGWREFDDGAGGEQFCQKCGLGAMHWSMWHV